LSGTPTISPEILSETINHVAFITLNRPAALNALSFEMITELRRVLQATPPSGQSCCRVPATRPFAQAEIFARSI
jgi:hypothetical protein